MKTNVDELQVIHHFESKVGRLRVINRRLSDVMRDLLVVIDDFTGNSCECLVEDMDVIEEARRPPSGGIMSKAANMGKVSDGYHTFDELYEHRHWLFINLMASHRNLAWASRLHSDGTSWDGWFVCGMQLPFKDGQISYHMPDRLWDAVEVLGIVVDRAPEWDGHDARDVILRLAAWCPDLDEDVPHTHRES